MTKNIEGIKISPLKIISDHRGSVMHMLRNDNQVFEKFGEILDLVPLSDSITKLHAFCTICKNGTPAHFTKRLCENEEQKLIGTSEYIPVCRNHL